MFEPDRRTTGLQGNRFYYFGASLYIDFSGLTPCGIVCFSANGLICPDPEIIRRSPFQRTDFQRFFVINSSYFFDTRFKLFIGAVLKFIPGYP